jgi:hypothetical protein
MGSLLIKLFVLLMLAGMLSSFVLAWCFWFKLSAQVRLMIWRQRILLSAAFSGIVRYGFTPPRRLLVAPLPGTDAHPWSYRLLAVALGTFCGSFRARCGTRLPYPLLSSEYDILDAVPAQVTMLA